MKTKQGGKRIGAGRKKSAPYIRHQINLDKSLFNSLKTKLSTKEINEKIRLFLSELDKSQTSET